MPAIVDEFDGPRLVIRTKNAKLIAEANVGENMTFKIKGQVMEVAAPVKDSWTGPNGKKKTEIREGRVELKMKGVEILESDDAEFAQDIDKAMEEGMDQ